MSLLTVKLLVTPLMVLAASLAARRWGDAVGGWLVGLPLISGPVSVFLALEQGPAFAADAAAGSIAGVVAQAAFCAGYAAAASRGLAPALAAGALAYVVSAGGLIAAGLPRAALFLAAVATLTLVLRAAPRRRAITAKPADAWEILARMGATTALVVGLTSAASALGPRVSGATASFPLIGASIAAYAQLAHGPAAGVSVMRGMAAALYAFAVFFLVAGAALGRMPVAAAFALATAGALVMQGVTLQFVRPHEKTNAAEGGAAASSGR